jgi:hypothetical protein
VLIQIANPDWQRRFTADPQRIKEATDLYQKLGYEVRTEAVHPTDFHDECGACHDVTLNFQTIYTRKKCSVLPGLS